MTKSLTPLSLSLLARFGCLLFPSVSVKHDLSTCSNPVSPMILRPPSKPVGPVTALSRIPSGVVQNKSSVMSTAPVSPIIKPSPDRLVEPSVEGSEETLPAVALGGTSVFTTQMEPSAEPQLEPAAKRSGETSLEFPVKFSAEPSSKSRKHAKRSKQAKDRGADDSAVEHTGTHSSSITGTRVHSPVDIGMMTSARAEQLPPPAFAPSSALAVQKAKTGAMQVIPNSRSYPPDCRSHGRVLPKNEPAVVDDEYESFEEVRERWQRHDASRSERQDENDAEGKVLATGVLRTGEAWWV